MGFCRYQYNHSELYQRTKPGQAPEVTCGARTFPAIDEPEIVMVRAGMGAQGAIYEYRETGNYVARAHDDPYCPEHGGSPEPPPPPVTLGDLEAQRQAYLELVAVFQAQHRGELPPGVDSPADAPPAITEADVREAAQRYLDEAAAQQPQEVTSDG